MGNCLPTSNIPDRFRTLEEVQIALRQNGLESSNLILAIDYTKSNLYTVCKLIYNNNINNNEQSLYLMRIKTYLFLQLFDNYKSRVKELSAIDLFTIVVYPILIWK